MDTDKIDTGRLPSNDEGLPDAERPEISNILPL